SFMSEDAVKSRWVNQEVFLAETSEKKQILRIDLHDDLVLNSDLASMIGGKHAIKAYELSPDEVVEKLEETLRGTRPPPPPENTPRTQFKRFVNGRIGAHGGWSEVLQQQAVDIAKRLLVEVDEALVIITECLQAQGYGQSYREFRDLVLALL